MKLLILSTLLAITLLLSGCDPEEEKKARAYLERDGVVVAESNPSEVKAK